MKIVLVLLLLLLPLMANNEKVAMVEEMPDSVERKLYNPLLTTTLSIVPGGGQIYTGHTIRGPLFLTTEVLLGTVAWNRWQRYHNHFDILYEKRDSFNQAVYKLQTEFPVKPTGEPKPISKPTEVKLDTNSTKADSLAYEDYKSKLTIYEEYHKDSSDFAAKYKTYKVLADSLIKDSILALNDYKLAEYDNREAKYSYYNYTTWVAGIYLWNLADGFGVSNHFERVKNPDPKKAAWLSAIPFTGAGQLYNGDIFKAGLVSTMELGCLISALRYIDLMDFAEDGYRSVASDSASVEILKEQRKEWETRYDDASKLRTRFIWYGVIFYMYGIFDAYVDAEFYEFREKFDILAHYDPITEGIGLNLTVGF